MKLMNQKKDPEDVNENVSEEDVPFIGPGGDDISIEEIELNPEKKYKGNTSSNFILNNIFEYEPTYQIKTNVANYSTEWDDRIIPELKTFMEGDNYSSFQIMEYIQQLKK